MASFSEIAKNTTVNAQTAQTFHLSDDAIGRPLDQALAHNAAKLQLSGQQGAVNDWLDAVHNSQISGESNSSFALNAEGQVAHPEAVARAFALSAYDSLDSHGKFHGSEAALAQQIHAKTSSVLATIDDDPRLGPSLSTAYNANIDDMHNKLEAKFKHNPHMMDLLPPRDWAVEAEDFTRPYQSQREYRDFISGHSPLSQPLASPTDDIAPPPPTPLTSAQPAERKNSEDTNPLASLGNLIAQALEGSGLGDMLKVLQNTMTHTSEANLSNFAPQQGPAGIDSNSRGIV